MQICQESKMALVCTGEDTVIIEEATFSRQNYHGYVVVYFIQGINKVCHLIYNLKTCYCKHKREYSLVLTSKYS